MRCLALNASFEPLTMVPVRRALRLVIEGKAEIVEAEHLTLKGDHGVAALHDREGAREGEGEKPSE